MDPNGYPKLPLEEVEEALRALEPLVPPKGMAEELVAVCFSKAADKPRPRLANLFGFADLRLRLATALVALCAAMPVVVAGGYMGLSLQGALSADASGKDQISCEWLPTEALELMSEDLSFDLFASQTVEYELQP